MKMVLANENNALKQSGKFDLHMFIHKYAYIGIIFKHFCHLFNVIIILLRNSLRRRAHRRWSNKGPEQE